MKLLRSATLTVKSVTNSVATYKEWLDYSVVEEGVVPSDLAESWGTPASAGRNYAVMQPVSGADLYIRFVEGDPVPEFTPLRTYGWAAIEICVTDVLAVNERMLKSPFEIIGPPKEIEGLPAIYPMQVKGPDGEIAYFTQIRDDLPAYDLPRASTLIDKLFILVMACSDMRASIKWLEDVVGLQFGRDMEIEYSMLANAFGTPIEQHYTISTVIHERDVFLELDQYPEMATPRPHHDGALPPGVALATLKTPDFDAIKGDWITPPVKREGPVYEGMRAGTLRAPDGTLVEIVEMAG